MMRCEGVALHKVEDGENTWVKVVGFPLPDGCGFRSESMWVMVIDGDENDGLGVLDSEPLGDELKQGDLIRYGGGTARKKPIFLGPSRLRIL